MMKPALSTRQAQIAEQVARGKPAKEIARDTGLAVKTVCEHIHEAAQKIPGRLTPRHKLTLWFFDLSE